MQNESAIRKMKMQTRLPELFRNELLLEKIFLYIKALGFDQKPDYKYIKSLLQEFKKKNNINANRLS